MFACTYLPKYYFLLIHKNIFEKKHDLCHSHISTSVVLTSNDNSYLFVNYFILLVAYFCLVAMDKR